MAFKPADLTEARGSVWRVVSVEQGEAACTALRLARVSHPGSGTTRTLITPFDHVRIARATGACRTVGRRAATRALLSLLVSDRTWCTPWGAADARVTLLWWQLAPLMTLMRGGHRRALVADGVGLGKTVQAGLVLRDAFERWPQSRSLVLCPAGIQRQWHQELTEKFGLPVDIVDRAWLERRSHIGPLVGNPWLEARVAISSLDFAKQQEVLPGPDHVSWDVVVIDEAHGIGTSTARAALTNRLGVRARHLLLLTGTPHNGDDARFNALCATGALPKEPGLALLQRHRGDVSTSLPHRWKSLRITPTEDERSLQRLLAQYLDALASTTSATGGGSASLLRHLLQKRAASSSMALARTALKRKAWLRDCAPVESYTLSLFSDFDTLDDVPSEYLRVPGLAQPRREAAWLGAIGEAALRASRAETKLERLRRLVARVHEPVLVFTEFRDTLAHVARHLRGVAAVEVLHGGQTLAERQRALDQFTGGRARVLVATDAASEGLNLHHRCRWVVMLDLPWMPTRLAQRIGRLDRFGQPKRVHALALTSGSAFERFLAARLDTRTERSARTLDATGARDANAETLDQLVAEEWVRLAHHRQLGASLDRATRPPSTSRHRCTTRRRSPIATVVPAVVCLPARSHPHWTGALAIVDAELSVDAGCLDRTVLGLHIPIVVPRVSSARGARAFVIQSLLPIEPELLRIARQHVATRWTQSTTYWRSHRALTHEWQHAERLRGAARLRQPSLFDMIRVTRSERAEDDARRVIGDSTDAVVHEHLAIVLFLLRPGPGRLRVAPPARAWRRPD